MRVCVKCFDNFCHCNLLYSNHLQTHFYFNDLQEKEENQIVIQTVYFAMIQKSLVGVLKG